MAELLNEPFSTLQASAFAKNFRDLSFPWKSCVVYILSFIRACHVSTDLEQASRKNHANSFEKKIKI